MSWNLSLLIFVVCYGCVNDTAYDIMIRILYGCYNLPMEWKYTHGYDYGIVMVNDTTFDVIIRRMHGCYPWISGI